MRDLATIDAEIADTARHLQALQIERIDARLAEKDRIVRLFCAGMSPDRIARTMGMTRGAVSGVLYREGMTVRGAHRIARQLDDNLREALRHRAPEQKSADGAR